MVIFKYSYNKRGAVGEWRDFASSGGCSVAPIAVEREMVRGAGEKYGKVDFLNKKYITFKPLRTLESWKKFNTHTQNAEPLEIRADFSFSRPSAKGAYCAYVTEGERRR